MNTSNLTAYYLQILFIIFIFLNCFLEIYLYSRQIKKFKQSFAQIPPEFQEKITADEHQKSLLYSIDKLNFGKIHLLWKAVLTFLWFPFRGAESLYSFLSFNGYLKEIFFIISFLVINIILEIPWNLYSTFVIEEKFGFNKTSFGLFFKDKLKGIILTTGLLMPLFYALFKLFDLSGQHWWLFSFFLLTFFQLCLIWIFPKYISPLFNKFLPLEDNHLKERISTLLSDNNLELKEVFVMNASIRSSHGNAYFTGLGKNKRIVFFDTLLKQLSSDELIAILAHEIGHMKLKHILKSLLTSIFLTFIGFYVLSFVANREWFFAAHFFKFNSVGILFLIFLQISSHYFFIFNPIISWSSRQREFEADAFAAKRTNPKDLISGLIKLYKNNSSPVVTDKIFSMFYHSHPPAKERIDKLQET